jgi:hypothetical protein
MLDLKIHYKTCSWQEGASAAQCAFDIPFISLFTFSPPKENPGNLPVRVLDLKEPEKIRSHWNKRKKRALEVGY